MAAVAPVSQVGRYPGQALAPVTSRVGQSQLRLPSATYRLQFGPSLGFKAARLLLPFLQDLGITDIYASPVFKARRGSTHGYDITDTGQLNPELGTRTEFEDFAAELRARGMGLILDIVPNHMAACSENAWWQDVLEEGPASRFARYFDIDWLGTSGRLIIPVLGESYEQVLAHGELKLAFDEEGLCVRYWEHRFPVALSSYAAVIGGVPPCAEALTAIRALPQTAAAYRVRIAYKRTIKRKLWALWRDDAGVRSQIERCMEECNHDPERLHSLVRSQNYTLAYWYTGRDQIRYRRFFDVNDLVGVRVEDPEVFRATHRMILRLARSGLITGLRIDHIDGLRDPHGYLHRLKRELKKVTFRPIYVTAEKILLNGERLPAGWGVAGTTGYDFHDAANGLFVDARNLGQLSRTFARFTGIQASFDDLVYSQKKRVIRDLFTAELAQLTGKLDILTGGVYRKEDIAAAIEEITASLGVYRTYIRSSVVANSDRAAIERAARIAIRRDPSLSGPAFSTLLRVLLLDLPEGCPRDLRAELLGFVQSWQQFTGPVMAKGVEDTAFYLYNPLVSLNIVGGGCRPVSVERFHSFNMERFRRSPGSLNATSTHDTKRSEDVRARINVLSEMPDLWEQCVSRWSCWNEGAKTPVHGEPAPSRNDEFLLYQVLVGAWPLNSDESANFKRRIQQFAIKAAREAKVHSNWHCPDAEYEGALTRFIDAILQPGTRFVADFERFQAYVAPFGAAASLSQLALKATSPGVPDFYQGTLVWDFSLVDPDNRRPVNFDHRMQLWRELQELQATGSEAAVPDLINHWQDGRIKMYTAGRLLRYRREHKELFERGEYVPLQVRGAAARHAVAYGRYYLGEWAVTVVPRLLAALSPDCTPLAHASLWSGTEICLPDGAPGAWRNVLGGGLLRGRHLPLKRVFESFPVAVLSGR